MHWIDPREFETWAGLHEAQAELPALVRRLVVNTVSQLTGLNVPSGSSVNLAGWDGVFESAGGSIVPAGKVVVEMSCGTDAAGKAKENYEKRTAKPENVVPAETTFIFVTPRVWVGKDDWVKERLAEGVWKDVKVFDATILSQWIDASPVVASYFARRIGKTPPSGFIALSDYWDEWAKETDPQCDPGLLMGSRDKQIESLKSWATAGPSAFFVQADKKDEAIAFLAAWAVTDEQGQNVFDRALVITNHDAWLELSRSKSPLILIPSFKEDYSATVATTNHHHVLTPLEKGERLAGNGCVLPRISRDAFTTALKKMGKNERDTNNLANTTGRHLPTLRRRLADHAGGSKPRWVTAADAKKLMPALLLGQWTGKEGDLATLAQLADKPVAEVFAEYQSYLAEPDSPLRKVGDHWRLTSHEEAWELLSPYLSQAEMDKFVPVATQILGELSPALDMQKDERYLAGIQHKVLSRSEVVREGISITLALMACRSERLDAAVSSVPLRVMRNVLEEKASDWKYWATASSELSTLVEAAPEELLTAIEGQLGVEPSPFLELFKQENSGVWSNCYHSGLLWALEQVAMSEEYFARAALCLARLAAIDPGGTYSNRPLESLRALFLGWIRYTDASDQDRLKVMDLIFDKVPEIGWKLLMEISPQGPESVSGRHPPTFREWGQKIGQGPTNADFHAYLTKVVERAIAKVGDDPKKWDTFVDHIPSLSDEHANQAFTNLETTIAKLEDKSSWVEVRGSIREMINRHRTFPETDWAMPVAKTDRLAKIYEDLTPSDPVLAEGWLFDYWPNLPEGGRKTEKEVAERAEEMQKTAYQQVCEKSGEEGIVRLIAASKNAGKAGQIAGKYFSDDVASRKLAIINLGHVSFPERAFAGEFAGSIFIRDGWTGLQKLLDDARAAGISNENLASVYLACTVNRDNWRRLESEHEDTQKSYWANLNTHALYNLPIEDYEYGVTKLLDYNRAPDVIDAMAYGREDVPTTLIVRALELAPKNLAAASKVNAPIRVSSHDIARVFEKLDQAGVDEDTISRLEVPYVSILHLDRPNLVLHREVVKNPTTFADLVTWVYKRADGESDDDGIPQEEREGRARTAWSILHHISVVPGQKPDGTVDADSQLAWVNEAKRLCTERGRDVVGRQTIGQALGCAPTGSDGVWPSEPVRKTLDALSDREIGRGFIIRKQNMRGVTSRGMYDGGEQERKLAERYRADSVKIRSEFPFTAGLLNQLADTYVNQATQQDDDSVWMDR